MSRLTITERVRRYLDKVPGAISGSGGHDQTFSVACVLIKGFALSIDEAREFMREYNGRCQPPWTEQQLEHKLISADKAKDEKPRGWLLGEDDSSCDSRPARSAPQPREQKTFFRPDKLALFAGEFAGKVSTTWLADRSVVEPALITTEDFLGLLYGEGEKVILFTEQRSQGQVLWPDAKAPLCHANGVWFLAQPVDGKEHPNPRTSKRSRRSEESVVSWRYLVIESDEADMHHWMGALVQLPLQITAIYTSGKRSIHALVRVDAGSKAEWDQERDLLKNPLIVLGADPKSLSAVRLTRLPGCMRGKRLQKLLYFNPSPDAVPICELPAVRDVAAHWLGWHNSLVGRIDNADNEQAPPGFLAALEFYARSNPLMDEAARHWRSQSSAPVAPTHE